MRFLGLIVGLLSMFVANSAAAISISSSAVLTSSTPVGLTLLDGVSLPPANISGGTLSIIVSGDFSGAANSSVFVKSSSPFVTPFTTREVQNALTFVPPLNKIVSTFGSTITFSKDDLTSLLADPLSFVFRSATPSVGNPYTVTATLNYAAVPEPTTLAVLGLGALGAVAARRRRK